MGRPLALLTEGLKKKGLRRFKKAWMRLGEPLALLKEGLNKKGLRRLE